MTIIQVALAGAAGLATLAGAGLFAFSVRKSHFEGGKTVHLKCHCGKFTGEVALPKKETQIAGLNCDCHCVDCKLWATEGVKYSTFTENGGTVVYVLHKATVKFNNPELVVSCRLYTESNTHRFKTSCCETSIGGAPYGASFCFMSDALIADEDRELLVSRLYPQNILYLREKKHTEQYKNNPNAGEALPSNALGRFVGMIVSGLKEMRYPTPFPEYDPKEIVIFPEGAPKSS